MPEFCTGENELCPINVFKQNGNTCFGEEGMCFDGTCKAKDEQCEMLWGSSAKSSDNCMNELNTSGQSYGHCGNNRQCSPENAICGLQHCTGGEDEPVHTGYR